MRWSQYLNIVNSVRAKTLQAKLDLFFKLMGSEGNGRLTYSEIKYLCSQTLKKLLESSDELFIDDLAYTFTKFVFEAMALDLNEEINVETLKNFMVNNTHSDEVDLLLMMCCAEKNQDELFLEDNIQNQNDDKAYIQEAAENNLKEKGVYFIKEENRLKKLLKFDPENKKLQRRSSVIQMAKEINEGKVGEKFDEEMVVKKKMEEELMERLKGKSDERKSKLIRFGGEGNEEFEEAFAQQQMMVLGQRNF